MNIPNRAFTVGELEIISAANSEIDKLKSEIDKLKSIVEAGYDLSTLAASINWHGGKNTREWLADLCEQIVNYQKICREVGIGMWAQNPPNFGAEPTGQTIND